MIGSKRSAIGIRTLCWGILPGLVLASGCLFEPRTAPPPSGDSVPWIRPISALNVMENMRNAVNGLQDTNYSNSLGANFVFKPSLSDINEAPAGYYDGFNKARELDALRKLFTRVDSLRIEWNFDENTDLTESGNNASLELKGYQLFVSYTGSDQVVYEGGAMLALQYDDESGQWFLIEWNEEDYNADQSWGRLRAILDV